jgi:hypothetical protein
MKMILKMISTQRRQEANAQKRREFFRNPIRVFACLRLCVPVLFGLFVVAGCVSKSTAKLQTQQAFLAGQQQAMMSMQPNSRSVQIRGNVKNTSIPWTEDLTLAKAIVAAEYQGTHDPTSILILRNGAGTQINAAELLVGHDEPLQPGDVIEIH